MYKWNPLSVDELNKALRELKCDWLIAGGFAIDLFIGKETRKHDDIDILINREDQKNLHEALPDWELFVADPPGSLRQWDKGEFLAKGIQDIWCRKNSNDAWRFQIMLFDSQNGEWIFKRNENIHKDLNSIYIIKNNGIKILAPEIQLLYKANSIREKDQMDFNNSIMLMNDEQKNWLKLAITEVYNNKHEWIKLL